MIRLIVRVDDAFGGPPQTTYRTFDIDHTEIEALLRGGGSNSNTDCSCRTVVGAELLDTPAALRSLQSGEGE